MWAVLSPVPLAEVVLLKGWSMCLIVHSQDCPFSSATLADAQRLRTADGRAGRLPHGLEKEFLQAVFGSWALREHPRLNTEKPPPHTFLVS